MPLDHSRATDAAENLVKARDDLARQVLRDDPRWSWLLATALLEADDAAGERQGMVTRADGISWAQLAALYRLAERERVRHLDTHGRVWHGDCRECQDGAAIHQTRIADKARALGG